MTTVNVPRTIASLVSFRYATLTELQTIYGVEDMYDMIEIAAVDSHNRYMASKKAQP